MPPPPLASIPSNKEWAEIGINMIFIYANEPETQFKANNKRRWGGCMKIIAGFTQPTCARKYLGSASAARPMAINYWCWWKWKIQLQSERGSGWNWKFRNGWPISRIPHVWRPPKLMENSFRAGLNDDDDEWRRGACRPGNAICSCFSGVAEKFIFHLANF